MLVLKDILGRAFFMSLFIALVPIGAYTIHTGSSALVAMVSYIVLSLCIPIWYVKSPVSGFGPQEKRVKPWAYMLGWIVVQLMAYGVFSYIDLSPLWALSTIGRDIAFLIVMYAQVVGALLLGYLLSPKEA